MSRVSKLIVPILISIPCLLLLAQCHVGAIVPILTGKKIWLSKQPQSVEQEVLRQVPICSPVETARDVMEQNGFECRYYSDETYYDHGTGAEFKNAAFYSCNLQKTLLLEAEIWSVELETKQGKLKRVSASYDDVTL